MSYSSQLSLILGREGRGRENHGASGRPDWMQWDGRGIAAARINVTYLE